MNEKQLEILEKVSVNSANVTLATMILGNMLNPKGFDLTAFMCGYILFVFMVGCALWLRRKKEP